MMYVSEVTPSGAGGWVDSQHCNFMSTSCQHLPHHLDEGGLSCSRGSRQTWEIKETSSVCNKQWRWQFYLRSTFHYISRLLNVRTDVIELKRAGSLFQRRRAQSLNAPSGYLDLIAEPVKRTWWPKRSDSVVRHVLEGQTSESFVNLQKLFYMVMRANEVVFNTGIMWSNFQAPVRILAAVLLCFG